MNTCTKDIADEPQECPTIHASAVKQDGVVYTLPRPARHDDVLNYMRALRVPTNVGRDEQGFITSEGEFVDRERGAHLALWSGQIKELKFQKKYLFSEDLW